MMMIRVKIVIMIMKTTILLLLLPLTLITTMAVTKKSIIVTNEKGIQASLLAHLHALTHAHTCQWFMFI